MARWNLHTNGISDQLTIHGGCPVLVGSKWITNKWVESEYDQHDNNNNNDNNIKQQQNINITGG